MKSMYKTLKKHTKLPWKKNNAEDFKYCFFFSFDIYNKRPDKTMSSFRGFIAIDLSATPKILEFENALTKIGADVKLVEPENIHITLKFLGDVEQHTIDPIDQIMNDAVHDMNPFTFTLKRTGVFPNQQYMKIIWIGIENEQPIITLAKILDEQLCTLGFTKEKREFSPHLTIGRVRTAKNKEQLLQTIQTYSDTLFGEFFVDSITLKKSDLTIKGPIYTTIKKASFPTR